MKKIAILIALAAATISAPVDARRATNILPAAYTFEGVAKKLENLKLTGCYLDQGDEVEFFQTGGRRYAANKKSLSKVFRDSGRNISTTLIALDAGHELCEVSPLR